VDIIWDVLKKEELEAVLHHLATAAVYIPDTALDLLRQFNRQEVTLKDIAKTVAAKLKHCRRHEKLGTEIRQNITNYTY